MTRRRRPFVSSSILRATLAAHSVFPTVIQNEILNFACDLMQEQRQLQRQLQRQQRRQKRKEQKKQKDVILLAYLLVTCSLGMGAVISCVLSAHLLFHVFTLFAVDVLCVGPLLFNYVALVETVQAR